MLEVSYAAQRSLVSRWQAVLKRIRGVATPTDPDPPLPLSQASHGLAPTLMAEIRTITPADAIALLEQNKINRALNKAAVNRYAAMMARGEWHVGNDAICIGEDGLLLNGQHRLNAVVLSETSQRFLVRIDVAHDDLKAMDQGNKRVGADIATLLGHQMSRAQMKALRLLGTDWAHTATMATPSVDELIALDDEWGPFLGNASKLLVANRRNQGIPIAAAAEALCWSKLDGRQQMVADFFSIMWENTPAGDRATDSKHGDFIPCQFHRYVNDLARNSKQLRTYQQYKLILVGLYAYINEVNLTRANKLEITSMAVPSANPFRG